MKVSRHVFVLLIAVYGLAACASTAVAPQQKPGVAPTKVLFVGNSFTYYNDSVHKHLRKLMRAHGIEPGAMRIMTISGSRLSEHEPAMPSILASDDWDAVVLQGHSREPIEENASFEEAIRKLHGMISQTGARTVLFMTWAYRDKPDMTKPLASAYTAIGNELGAVVVPVGLATALSAIRHPDITLIHDDRRHPTLAGTYLAACVLLAALYDTSPVNNVYTAGLDPQHAAALQSVAWTTTQNYYASP